jgi:GDPmannose 4,6-dehydratase
VNYREAYGIYACNGILFNHESPLRGETFVTRKITRAAAKISLGLQEKLYLGNLNSERDWGHAKDYIEGMWLMLQQSNPEDYVLATGKKTSVRNFVRKSFASLDIELEFTGEGTEEKGIVKTAAHHPELIGKTIVVIDPEYFRPTEVDLLIGDASKAKEKLGWEPKYNLDQLIEEMVKSDVELFKRDKYLSEGGFKITNQYE